MARMMSVTLTIDAVRARIKTETRRVGWTNLTPGTDLVLVEKAMGLRKGEHVVRVAEVRVVSVHRERLCDITQESVIREGFPHWTPEQFVAFFTSHMGCKPEIELNVVAWDYLDLCPTCNGHEHLHDLDPRIGKDAGCPFIAINNLPCACPVILPDEPDLVRYRYSSIDRLP